VSFKFFCVAHKAEDLGALVAEESLRMLQLNRSGNPDIRKAALLAAGKRVRFAETKEEEGESRDQNLSGTGTATGLNAFSGVN
jgi:hypothetical protein